MRYGACKIIRDVCLADGVDTCLHGGEVHRCIFFFAERHVLPSEGDHLEEFYFSPQTDRF